MRELPKAFSSQTPRQATSDLPAIHSLQMDGGSSDDVDRGGADAVPGPSEGRPDEPGRRLSPDEQDNHNCIQVPNRGRDMMVQVRREDHG